MVFAGQVGHHTASLSDTMLRRPNSNVHLQVCDCVCTHAFTYTCASTDGCDLLRVNYKSVFVTYSCQNLRFRIIYDQLI